MASATTEVKRKAGVGSRGETKGPLSAEELRRKCTRIRTSNYLSVGQIFSP